MKVNTKIILAILAAVFGFLALYYGVKYHQVKGEAEVFEMQTKSANSEYYQLVDEFEVISNELDSMILSRKEAYSELDQKTKDLEKMQAEISRLLRQGELSRAELNKAREMIDNLRVEKNNLLAQIENLNAENVGLRQQNETMTNQIKVVSEEKSALEEENTSLTTENVSLQKDNEELVAEREENKEKVLFSQVVPVKNIFVDGLKYKNSGRETTTSNYKRVDKLAINFTVSTNPVADNGPKEYLVRVINPDGTVAYDRSRGSGDFVSAESEGMKFTTNTAIDYQSEEKKVTIFWRQDIPFQKGNYLVEIYQSGYKVGESNFELKGGL